MYSHLFNKRGGWNKRGGGAKIAKSLNVQVGINVEDGIFWKKLVHKGPFLYYLRKGIEVGGWSRKWQFSLTVCNKNVLT